VCLAVIIPIVTIGITIAILWQPSVQKHFSPTEIKNDTLCHIEQSF